MFWWALVRELYLHEHISLWFQVESPWNNSWKVAFRMKTVNPRGGYKGSFARQKDQ